MSFRVVAKVLRYSEATLASRLILIVLAEAAHDDGVAWLDQTTIAVKARLSRTHVAEKIREMERDGLLETRKAQRGRRRIAVYRLNLPGLDEADYDRLPFALNAPFTASEDPTPSASDDVGSTDVTASDLPGISSVLSSYEEEPPREPGPHTVLCASWLERTPPLIAHRETYFADAKAKRATERALRVYPVEVVAEAITNYAMCLGGAEYRWSHRWTFVDFLNRGLDKFVPEAEPLRNFAVRGRAPLSEDERRMLDDIPDLGR